jgi:MFS family permease
MIQMIGLSVGALTFAQISDLFGRKKPYFVGFSILILSGFGSAFAPCWEIYALCRFFVGLGFGAQKVVNCVFLLEFVGRRWRTVCGTVGFWAVGQLILALLVKYLPFDNNCYIAACTQANYIREWRHLVMATSISGVLYYFTWL